MQGIISTPGRATRPMNGELALDELMRQFVEGKLPKPMWTHRAHMSAALAHVLQHGEDGARRLMRERIMAYNLSVGGKPSDYHETVTVAWVRIIADFTRRHPGLAPEELRARMFAELGGRDHLLGYYSLGRLFSDAARVGFVEPDLKPLP